MNWLKILVVSVGLFGLGGVQAAWHIVTPIKPIQSLVMGVVGDVAEVDVIVSGAKTPHGFQLKPSHIRQIHQADWVVRVDPNAERYLNKAVSTVPAQKITYLSRDFKQPILQKRQGLDWASHAHAHHGHHERGLTQDFHVWLDPSYAMDMVKTIAREASLRQPQWAEQFARNSERILAKLNALDVNIQRQLNDVKDQRYWVFHDAYQYFEKRYDMKAQGAIRLEPNVSPSVKRVREIQEQLQAHQSTCVFAEPQFSRRMVGSLVRGTQVRSGVLDPLGGTIAAGQNQYFELMRDMANSLKDCLQ